MYVCRFTFSRGERARVARAHPVLDGMAQRHIGNRLKRTELHVGQRACLGTSHPPFDGISFKRHATLIHHGCTCHLPCRPSSPCMHRVWSQCDSGDPVTKQTRHHVRFLQKVDFGLPRAKFFISSRFGPSGLSDVSTDTARKKMWSNRVLSYFVRTVARE